MNTPLDLLKQVQPAEIRSGMYDQIVQRIEAEKKMSFTGRAGKLALAGLLLLLCINLTAVLQSTHKLNDTRQLVNSLQLSNDNDLYQ